MNPIKQFYCRAVQAVLHAALPVLPYREPKIFHSCGELNAVFARENIRRVLIVTDEGIVRSGIAAHLQIVLERSRVDYAIYSETRPNPTTRNVEQALALYRRENCQALIAIGGGSSMDCANAVGARLARPRTPLGMLKGTLRIWRKIPTLIAIPTQLEGIRAEDIPVMAAHAEREANPLYPVPRLLTQAELEPFYYRIARAGCQGKQAS